MQTLTDFLPAWLPTGASLAQLIASVTVVALALHVILGACAYTIAWVRSVSCSPSLTA